MAAAGRGGRWLACVLAALFVCLAASQAQAQDRPQCAVVRLQPGGILEQCGDQLCSLMLALNDIVRRGAIDASGIFSFVCPIEELCVEKPRISGWLIDPRRWNGSTRNEQAILEIFQQTPRGPG